MTKKKREITVPMGKGVSWWQGLSPDQKKSVTFPRLEAGDSNASIGNNFEVTPGSIASMRTKWNNNYHHVNPFILLWAPTKQASEAVTQTPKSIPATVTEPSDTRAVHIRPDPPRQTKYSETQRGKETLAKSSGAATKTLAASEATQCTYSGKCGYERLPGVKTCGRSGHNK